MKFTYYINRMNLS